MAQSSRRVSASSFFVPAAPRLALASSRCVQWAKADQTSTPWKPNAAIRRQASLTGNCQNNREEVARRRGQGSAAPARDAAAATGAADARRLRRVIQDDPRVVSKPLSMRGSMLSGGQHAPAPLGALPHRGHRIAFFVLPLDERGNRVPLALEQQQDLAQRRIALAEGKVGSLIALAVFQVDAPDARVVFTNEPGRVEAGGPEVAHIQVDAHVGRAAAEGCGEIVRSGELVRADAGMVVKADPHLVFDG